MAEQKMEIVLKWENNVSFEMTSKLNDGNKITTVHADENAHLPDGWSDIESYCKRFFAKQLNKIGEEMKMP